MVPSRRFADKTAALNFIKTLSIREIEEMLSSFLVSPQQKKIILSQEEFDSHFRIRGLNENGNQENRGRKKKSVTV